MVRTSMLFSILIGLSPSLALAEGAPKCKSAFTLGGLELSNLDQAFPDKISLKELLEHQPDLRLSDDLITRDGRETFHDANPFMGFVSVGDRMLLVSRNPRILNEFSADLETGADVFNGQKPQAFQIRELPGYKAFDISKASYLTAEIRALHGRRAWDDGPNCWNLCQIYKGWAKTAFATDGAEFGLWVDGPFSKPAKSNTWGGFSPKNGDVIVFRGRNFRTGDMGEVHGAIALGSGLVFTKNGTSYSARYQVTTYENMSRVYMPGLSNSVQFREIRAFDEVWTEWSPKVSPELSGYVNRWISFEREHSEFFMPGKDVSYVPPEKYDPLVAQKRALQKEIGAIVKDRLKDYEGRTLQETELVEQFFWRLLQARTETAMYH